MNGGYFMPNSKSINSRISAQSSYENACKHLIKCCMDIREKAINAKTEEEHKQLDILIKTLYAELDQIKSSYKSKVESDVLQSKLREFNDFEDKGSKLLDPHLRNLYSIYEIYNSDLSEYSKVEKITKIYPTARDLNADYFDIAPLFIEKAFNFFETLIEIECLIKKYENNREIIKVRDDRRLEGLSYFDNYDYAKFIANEYINSEELDINLFSNTYGLLPGIMDYCENTLKELDLDTYNKYMSVKMQKQIALYNKYYRQFETMYEGIINGYYINEDGREVPFNEITLISLLPRLETKHFYMDLKRILKKCNIDDTKANVIFKYVINKGLTQISLIDNYKTIAEIVSVAGIPVSNEEKNLVVAYMRSANLPLNESIFKVCLDKFRKYELNLLDIEENDYQNKEKCTIVQSSRKRSN